MSLEAVKMVTQAEQNAKARKAQSVVDARKLVADAERNGAQSVVQSQTYARKEIAKLMDKADARAAAHLTEVIRETEGTCDQLRAEAQKRLSKAASLIVRRVVDG